MGSPRVGSWRSAVARSPPTGSSASTPRWNRLGPSRPATRPRRAAFEVRTADGRRFLGRKLLLATGVRDVLPAVVGARRYYGRGVHHCPYCDGWENRDRCLVAYGAGRPAVGLALSLRTWSDRVTACTDGKPVGPADRRRLGRQGIAIRTERVVRLEGSGGVLRRVVFGSGPSLDCDALFFNTDQVQHSPLADMLGCEHSARESDQDPRPPADLPARPLPGGRRRRRRPVRHRRRRRGGPRRGGDQPRTPGGRPRRVPRPARRPRPPAVAPEGPSTRHQAGPAIARRSLIRT